MIKEKFRSVIRLYRFNSIFVTNFIKIFGSCFSIFLLIEFIVMMIMTVHIKKEMADENYSLLQNVSTIADLDFKEIERVSANFAVDINIRQWIKGENQIFYNGELEKYINGEINAYKRLTRNIHSVYVYSEKMDKICAASGAYYLNLFDDVGWIEQYNSLDNNGFTAFARTSDVGYPDFITFVKKVENSGAVIVNLNLFEMDKVLRSIVSENSDFYIVDNDDNIIYSKRMNRFMQKTAGSVEGYIFEKNLSGIFNYGGQVYAGNIKNSLYYDWKYVMITSWNDYSAYISELRVVILSISTIFMLVSIVMAGWFSASIFNPIMKLINIVDFADKSLIKNLKDNEVRYIANKIMTIIDDNKEIRNEIRTRFENYNKYQIQALQTQINPHFLNNTLSNINYMVISGTRREEASEMIIKLTRLVRYCFVNSEVLVSLAEELRFANIYVEFMKNRYSNFEYITDIPEELIGKKVLRLCLQPLVENSIYHGFADTDRNGLLKISAHEKNGRLVIEVYDDGDGISYEDINKIKVSFLEDTFEKKHIGMKNLYRRLAVVFDNNADMRIESVSGEYTKITLIFP